MFFHVLTSFVSFFIYLCFYWSFWMTTRALRVTFVCPFVPQSFNLFKEMKSCICFGTWCKWQRSATSCLTFLYSVKVLCGELSDHIHTCVGFDQIRFILLVQGPEPTTLTIWNPSDKCVRLQQKCLAAHSSCQQSSIPLHMHVHAHTCAHTHTGLYSYSCFPLQNIFGFCCGNIHNYTVFL